MKRGIRLVISLIAGLVVLTLLIGLTVLSPPDPSSLLPASLFCVLIIFTTTFGVPLAGGRGSLLPMTTAAAFLVLGSLPTAWAAFVGAAIHSAIRYLFADRLRQWPKLDILGALGVGGANAAVQTLSVLAGGWAYHAMGGSTPLTHLLWSDLIPLVLSGLTYLFVNLLFAGLWFAARGRESLEVYLRAVSSVIIYEGWPMVFSPLMALIYTQLGLAQFNLVALAIVVTSLIARSLSLSSRRLERRVKELDSLQAVGQALSASLDLDSILQAIHTQVANLMPAQNFYVALYDRATGEVSFPLATEKGEQVQWRSRKTGLGLTEYILRTRAPLLIKGDYDATLQVLAIEKFGRPAMYWLGVPILAGDEPLGVICVQSFSSDQEYDLSHQEVLTTIAAQAAVAIQNAHLYAQTDEALARRVQELDSILRTTQDGMLLFDMDYRIIAANRALADLLDVAQLEMIGQDLRTPCLRSIPSSKGTASEAVSWMVPQGRNRETPSLTALIGYEVQELQDACQALVQDGGGFARKEITLSGSSGRCVERTLTPVRDPEAKITGWLLVFRDVTEERELAQLRDDMTDMLIHDLRSPLTVLMSSVELMKADLEKGHTGALGDLIGLAEKSSGRLLRLVNDLLDISRLESGQMEICPLAADVEAMLDTVKTRFAPLAAQSQIGLEVSCEPDCPLVYVDLEIMDRVLHNLVDNALKFTPDGGQVQLWARLPKCDSEAGADPRACPDGDPTTVLVGVSDTGSGIPPEAQTRLFKKFQQVTSTVGRRMGTGLGLPFCKLAVEAHGGEIWVESTVGEGSTFVVRLPTATREPQSFGSHELR